MEKNFIDFNRIHWIPKGINFGVKSNRNSAFLQLFWIKNQDHFILA